MVGGLMVGGLVLGGLMVIASNFRLQGPKFESC